MTQQKSNAICSPALLLMARKHISNCESSQFEMYENEVFEGLALRCATCLHLVGSVTGTAYNNLQAASVLDDAGEYYLSNPSLEVMAHETVGEMVKGMNPRQFLRLTVELAYEYVKSTIDDSAHMETEGSPLEKLNFSQRHAAVLALIDVHGILDKEDV